MRKRFFVSLMILIPILATITLDQILLDFFLFGPPRTSKEFKKTPFHYHPKHSFLINPKAVQRLHQFAPKYLDEVKYVVDEFGMREGLPRGDKKIVVNVFGDSFTFGLLLEQGKTFVDHLNVKSDRCWFKNYGVPAFSLVQMIGLAEDTSIVTPADITLFVFISDDVFRSVRYRELVGIERSVDLERIRHDFLPNKSFINFRIPRYLRNNSYVFDRLYNLVQLPIFWKNVTFSNFYNGVIRYYQNKYPEQNALFVYLPSEFEFHLNFPSISIPVPKDQQKFNSYYIKGDGHPSELGAEWIAQGIMERLGTQCF